MWRAVVGFDLIRIELFGRRAGIAEELTLRPMHKVVRSGHLDVAPSVIKIANIRAVFADVGIPEGQILGIERVTGHDRLRVVVRRPMDTIGRLERIQTGRILSKTYRLVLGPWLRCRIGIFEDRQIVALAAVNRPHHNVVRLGPIKFKQSECRFVPVNAVFTFTITDVERMILPTIAGNVPGMIVHTIAPRLLVIRIIEHRVVTTPIPFPRRVMDHRDFSSDRMV